MERIQQALEKAKQQRQENAVPPKPGQQVPVLKKEAEEKVAYTQTRTVEVTEDVFRQNRVVAALKDDVRADLFKILRTKVLQRMQANNWNVLAISSPTSEGGKSLTAVNLAISIAMDAKYSVLLVDLDLRRPGVHRYFNIEPEYGLSDYFDNNKDLSELLFNPGLESLVILPAGKPTHRSSDLLSTPKMQALADELKHRYPDRIVVVDLPPLLQTDDALMFMPNVDACVLVVAEGENTTEEVQQSISLIGEKKYLGSILNKSAEISKSSYAYYG